jgi:predicted aspartyl protease
MPTRTAFRLAGAGQPLILVPVHVDETGPYDFILDTGAGTSLLAPELARKLGIEGSETKIGYTAGGEVTASIGIAKSLGVGTAKLENVEVAIMDMSDLGKAVGARIDGDIGYNYLKHFRVTVDYRHNMLLLARGQHETVGKAVLKEIPFRLAAPVKPLVVVGAFINGHGPYDLALDTGNSTTLISPEIADRCGITGLPVPGITTGGGHKVSASAGNLESLTIGAASIRNLPVVIADVLGKLSEVTGVTLHGIVGYNFLRAFTLTIDYPNHVLHLES